VRWIWIDRFEEFVPGRRATAIKSVSLAEEYLHDHVPGFPIMPASLLIEGMAQTAGILVGQARQFSEKVILAKIRRAKFYQLVGPGRQVRFKAIIDQLSDAAASTTGQIYCDGELVGEVDLVFSHIDQNLSGLDFPQENFVFTEQFMSLLKLYQGAGAERVRL